MLFFASQLRSVFSPQRSIDRPLPPPFFRREPPRLASPFSSRHDVTDCRPTIKTKTTKTPTPTPTTIVSRAARLPAMTLCKFYQQGNCKFGNSCRFEHPGRGQTNRFGALSAGANGGSQSDRLFEKYNISIDVLTKDLTTDRPQWILSAYAPGKDAPDQLFGGYPREQSFEEMRLHHLTGKASGNEQQALSQAQELYQNAQQQIDTALRNVQEAARFVAEGESRHPNRHDVCREATQGAPFGEFLVGKRPRPSENAFDSAGGSSSSTFGQPSQPSSAFGQPSALGQRPNPFGAPAFGQTAQPAGSTFGQPSSGASAFAQPSSGGSAFGQTSQPGSAFGQPSALGAKPNPFGTPTFGQPAQPGAQANSFGQSSQPNAQGSAFGQPSQLGPKPNPFASGAAATTNSSPFASLGGNNSNAAPAANPFGAPNPNQTNNAPAASPFGGVNSNQTSAAPNPFASNNATQNNITSPFGQPAQSAGPFGQAATPASNPFGSAQQQPAQEANNPFGQKPQPATNGTFGQPANPFAQNSSNASNSMSQQPAASRPNPFGAQTGQPAAASNPAASTASANPYPPGSSRQHPPLDSYSARGMDGRLTAFKGKPVAYRNGLPGNRTFDGTWTRIWFPNGPPAYCKDTELPIEEYNETTKAQWQAFAQSGVFADGIMPDLPPPRECTVWDF
ncbi:hypothetical protein HIM_02790 [Hirsutella minnesotensis 3608]|nr:hypothetical protein HIM_02790 [Hirsutella minnesotensis 3608]